MKKIEIGDVSYQVVETIARATRQSIPETFNMIVTGYLEILLKEIKDSEESHE